MSVTSMEARRKVLGEESEEMLKSMGMVGLARSFEVQRGGSGAQTDAGDKREGAGARASQQADKRILPCSLAREAMSLR